jgi:hypothetical protein
MGDQEEQDAATARIRWRDRAAAEREGRLYARIPTADRCVCQWPRRRRLEPLPTEVEETSCPKPRRRVLLSAFRQTFGQALLDRARRRIRRNKGGAAGRESPLQRENHWLAGASEMGDRGFEPRTSALSERTPLALWLEARLWNPARTSVKARVGGQDHELGRADQDDPPQLKSRSVRPSSTCRLRSTERCRRTRPSGEERAKPVP